MKSQQINGVFCIKSVLDTTSEFISVYKKYVILCKVVTMKIITAFFIVVFLFSITGCQTIENKSQRIIKEENDKLSKFLQQPESELRIVMGEPDNIIKNDKGTTFLVYTKKKYNITCERKFEIDKNKMVVGFTSKGCF